MRILILGGDGMLGHQFYKSWQPNHEVMVTLRKDIGAYKAFDMFNYESSYYGVAVQSLEGLEEAIGSFGPEAVVNAIGITKQRTDKIDISQVIQVNALFPHQLADLCEKYSVRLVHLSTDCVFSGSVGFYADDAISDAQDLYGRTKYLGEVSRPHVITIRKSTIGLELAGKHGLVEWFLKQTGDISGYQGAIYSGLISAELANVIEMVLLRHKDLHGIWNVASKPVSKYYLLTELAKRLNKNDIKIIEDNDFQCDRSLDSSRFEKITGYKAPEWSVMLDEVASQILARDSNINK